MTNIDQAKEKIKKLLALSKSSNVNEASLAMEMAHKMMSTFSLTEQDMLDFINDKFIEGKNFLHYQRIIARQIANLYMVIFIYTDKKRCCEFVGEKLYVNIANEMYNYLISVIDRAAKQANKKNGGFLTGKSALNNFKIGMAAELASRIEKFADEVSWAPERPKMQTLAKKWYQNNCMLQNNFLTNKKSTVRHGVNGYYEGMDAAKNVSLNRQCAGVGGKPLEIGQ